MAKRKFKTESKKLLDLMINSIYTHKEIFLRELISNASDAIDKLYFKYLTDTSIKNEFCISIEPNKEKRSLKITDNGIGMTKDELDVNLGTIAKSGSLDFKDQAEKENIDIIGQFGVGFYSAFMVANKVCVTTKAYGSKTAYEWVSGGIDGYEINEAEKDDVGTCVTLYLKEDTDNENYSQFLDEYTIKRLVKKHSDYIRYPIKMECSKQRKKEGKDEFETYMETDTLNSMVPIWRKDKKDLGKEDLNNFYKDKFNDFENPAKVIRSKTEGAATYNALLFVPSHPPFDYYTKGYEKGLLLYSSGVLIMEKCSLLIPDHFSFIKGLVDSEDLTLNISRETLQHDRQLKLIEKSLEKKIKNELLSWLKNDRKSYEEFFKNFGVQLKFGVYSEFGAHKDICKDLIMFISSSNNKYVTLAEYVSKMKEDQKEIYYIFANNIDNIASTPQMEYFLEHGIEVLYLTDSVDEFALKMLGSFDDKPFKNIADSTFNLENEAQKTKIEKDAEQNKPLLEFMKEALKDDVCDVKLTGRLKNGAVCLSSGGEMSIEMEKILNAMPNSQKVKADRVLEINPNHKIFDKLKALFADGDKETVTQYAQMLYTQAALIEGIMPKNPSAFAQNICDMMAL